MQKKLWIAIGVVLTGAIVLGVFNSGVSKDIDEVQDNLQMLVVEKEKEQKRLDGALVEFDDEGYKEEVDVKTVNAIEIGNEVVDIQNKLADMFRVDGNLSQAKIDKRLKVGPELGERQGELTDIDPSFYYNTWKLNRDWDLKLESVLSYSNVSSFPIVFTMSTKKGEPAGLVKATYNVEDNQLFDIEIHYTAIGEQDMIQGVGD